MPSKEVEKNAKLDAKDTRNAQLDAVDSGRAPVKENDKKISGDDGTDGRLVEPEGDPLPSPFPKTEQEEINEEATPVDIAPEEGAEGQVPVATPHPIHTAPISSVPAPNVQRDAEAIALEKNDLTTFGTELQVAQEITRADRKKSPALRDARDLAAMIRAFPFIVNELDQIELYEKRMGIEDAPGWVKNPVDLLEEAKRYNMSFIDRSGNYVANSY